MIGLAVDYATPSALCSERDRALLGLVASALRPVRFHGRVVADVLSLRLALQTLGELVWSDDTWMATDDYRLLILDPVVTVHPDRVFFEAFSQDQSAYGAVIADRALFETDGEVACGTTNVDFTAALWASLAEMRSSRETWLRIEAAGFEVATVGAGGRYQAKVDLPESWVRGFLQLQAAMAFPGTRLALRPVDLLAAIRFLRYTKAKVSPRALRYELEPDQEARLVLEPWEKTIPLRGAGHSYAEPRTIRTWGRRRLRLIEPLLPYADGARVYLKGRAMPSFYAVDLPGVTFLLGLSGWTGAGWTGSGGFDLGAAGRAPQDDVDGALAVLARDVHASSRAVAEETGLPLPRADAALVRLCRAGRAIYDVERREFRHRELFATPVDEEALFPPDPRSIEAARLLAEGAVRITTAAPRETQKRKKLPSPDGRLERIVTYRDWVVSGAAGDHEPVEIVVNDVGTIIFGTCVCEHFRENLLNLGPCAHMLALRAASEAARADLPTSTAAPGGGQPKRRRRRAEEEGEDEAGEDEAEEDLDEGEEGEDD